MTFTILILLGVYLASAFLGTMVIELMLIVTYKRRLFDKPDARKVHKLPVPRLGGVSFLPVVMITVAVTVGMMYHMGSTAIFEREPASRAIAMISTVPSATSATSCSNRHLTRFGCLRETRMRGPFGVLSTWRTYTLIL